MKNLRTNKLFILFAWSYFIYLTGMYFMQEKLIFFPSQTVHLEIDTEFSNSDHFSLPIDEKTTIDGYFFKVPDANQTIIFFHGNGGNITSELGYVETLRSLNKNIVTFDYRGYGKSTGSLTKESDLYDDSEKVYKYILDKYKLKPQNIVFWGHSLGGAIATEMATRHKVGKLVIVSSFSSLREMMFPVLRYTIPSFFVKYKFNSLSKIENIDCPILIIHSTEDEIIPFINGENLFSKIKNKGEILEIKGNHNTGFYDYFEENRESIQKFLEK